MKAAIITSWRQKLAVELQKEGRRIFKRKIYAALWGENKHELENCYLAHLKTEDFSTTESLELIQKVFKLQNH